MSNIDLDLDALAGKSSTIKIGGKTLEIMPPSVEKLFSLQSLAGKMQNGEDGLDSALTEFKDIFIGLVPEIEGMDLNLNQYIALLEFLIDKSVPSDAKALEAEGITVDTDQKKTPSSPSEK